MRGTLPFASAAPEIVIRKTIKGDYSITDLHWTNMSEQARDLTSRLLEKDPEKRISLIEALVHPWITDRAALKQYKGSNRTPEDEESPKG